MSVYESTSWTTIRQRLLRELDLGIIVPNSFVGAFAAGSFTSSNFFQGSASIGGADLQNRQALIYRPGSATAADNIRQAGAITNSSGLVAHDGANYADTTVGTEAVELWYWGIRPDQEILDAVNRRLQKVYYSGFAWVSHLGDLDGDMHKSTTADFSSVGSPTVAKSTTARRTPFGLRSLSVINGSANEGVRTATISLTKNLQVRVMGISSVDVGTASLQPYSVSGSATFGTAVTHTEEEPQLMICDWASTTTAEEVQANMLGQESNASVFWNAVALYKEGLHMIRLPTYISEGYKLSGLLRMRPTQTNPNTSNCYVAESIDPEQLEEGLDYRPLIHQGSANPYAVVMTESYMNKYGFDYPLAVEVRRPWADFGTFTSESSTTQAPLNELIPHLKLEILDTVYLPRFPTEAKYIEARAKAAQELALATQARPIKSIAKKTPYFYLPISGAGI